MNTPAATTRRDRGDPSRLTTGARNVLRNNQATLREEVPPPGTWWVNSLPWRANPDEVDEVVAGGVGDALLARLRHQNLVKSEAGVRLAKGCKPRKRYQLRPVAWAYLQELAERDDGLPCCGATGFHNDPDGGYECKGCGAEHDRDTIEEEIAKHDNRQH